MPQAKWYNSAWFMWVMLIFFWPVGAYLLYRRRDKYEDQIVPFLIGVLTCAFMVCAQVIGHAPKTPQPVAQVETPAEETAAPAPEITREQEQSAFRIWKDRVLPQITACDNIWIEYYRGTLDGMRNGTIDQYTAYNRFVMLETLCTEKTIEIGKIPAIGGMTEAHEKALNDAKDKLTAWQAGRVKVAKALAEEINKISPTYQTPPKKKNEINHELTEADNLMKESTRIYYAVAQELGLENELE